MKPIISVIVPVLHEQAAINDVLSHLHSLPLSHLAEIIVVDGDPLANTLAVIRDKQVVKIKSVKGRGVQLALGAKHAKGDLLLFLHADTFLPKTAFCDILTLRNRDEAAASAFDFEIDEPGFRFRIIEKAASLRSRLTGIPYGDQAVCVKRTWFDRIGGMKPYPIMEDVDLMQRLKKHGGKVRFFSSPVTTSGRRWKKEGVISCTLRNWAILILYCLGASPLTLTRYYGD